jgi:hypothetical protein
MSTKRNAWGSVVRFNGQRGRNLERQQRLRFNNGCVVSRQEHTHDAGCRSSSCADRRALAPTSRCTDGRAEPARSCNIRSITSHRCRRRAAVTATGLARVWPSTWVRLVRAIPRLDSQTPWPPSFISTTRPAAVWPYRAITMPCGSGLKLAGYGSYNDVAKRFRPRSRAITSR